MFSILKNAWKIPDLRKKILYTVLLLIVFRLGSHIPLPFIDRSILPSLFGGNNTLFGLANIISGNALSQATIFAMSITPYINSSIIMQLLTVAIPALERLSKEGEEGKKKIAKITRVVTIVLAFVQASGLFIAVADSSVKSNFAAFFVVVLTLTAGTAFLMWLGEQINEKGVGNGISMIIFAGIISGAPTAIMSLIAGAKDVMSWVIIVSVLLVTLIVIGFIVLMNNAERRIPVQYAKRVVGRKMYGGQSTHVPIKVAMAGVMPIIFAVSILAFPATIAQMFGGATTGFWAGVIRVLSPGSIWYSIIYFILIILFTFFYTEIQFNPVEIANNMKTNGGFVPGLRPGKPTSDFIRMVLNRITMIGAVFIALIAVLPTLLSHINSAFAFGGSSLIIVVGVAIETVKQIESQMLMRHYKGFLE